MKKFAGFLLSIPLLVLGACEREGGFGEDTYRGPEEEVYHGMIELGEKLEDPYTVENMKEALAKVYPTKSERVDLVATDLYVRFLPEDDSQMKRLLEDGLQLMDHPMDYRIVREGDYYQDPEVGDENITWQYAVVPREYRFPAGIRYELLDKCYIPDNDPLTRADGDGIDWSRVEEEAFRLTGNEDLWTPQTKAGAAQPEGRITIVDEDFIGGKPFGVAGVKVVCNVFVKMASAYTDRDGYYKFTKSFSGKPRYRLVFSNEKGFNIGFNFIIVPASVSTLGKCGPEGVDLQVSQLKDASLFRRCTVNNACYDYYERCNETDLDILAPPGDLRIWIFPDMKACSTPMLHHGAALDHKLLVAYIGVYLPIVKLFLPDVTLGAKEKNYAGIYRATMHELAHASHYAQVGNGYWGNYIDYVIRSYITEGRNPYGSGTGDKSGYCEIGEMWAYFLEETLFKDRYGGTLRSFGRDYWFKPDIFSYLYERGMSRGEIYRALTEEVTSIDDLKDSLVSLYPERESYMLQTFQNYGK